MIISNIFQASQELGGRKHARSYMLSYAIIRGSISVLYWASTDNTTRYLNRPKCRCWVWLRIELGLPNHTHGWQGLDSGMDAKKSSSIYLHHPNLARSDSLPRPIQIISRHRRLLTDQQIDIAYEFKCV